jgi:hypothetical protein
MIAWCVFAVLLFFRFYDGTINNMNATMMAFNYSYGFVSRGFIGTLYLILDYLTPGSMYNYLMALKFAQCMTAVFFLFLFGFMAVCIGKVSEERVENLSYLLFFFTLCAIPMFITKYNLGRLDMYLVVITLLGCVLLIFEKAEWLLVPMTAVAIMIHQGYAFMFYNVLLVLLFYKWMSSEEKKRQRKYAAIFFVSLALCIILFFWFEIFSHVDGKSVVDEIVANAAAMCENGNYHKDVIDHEILGVDLTEREVPWHYMNFVQLPIAIILYLPFLWILLSFLKEVMREANQRNRAQDKLKYLAFVIGSFTLLPEFLLKVDYGRWVFAFLTYYCITSLVLIVMGDENVQTAWQSTMQKVKQIAHWLPAVLLAYAVLLQPCLDVCINDITATLSQYLNENYLHLWTLQNFTDIYF